MRKLLLEIALATALLAGIAPAGAADRLQVVCTLTDLGWIAEQVGGEDVEVNVLCPGEYDPHFLPARPSLARALARADLLCYNGLELEVGWLPVLLDKARNPSVRPGRPGHLDCTEAIAGILEVPDQPLSRAQGDVHPHGNPHYLLDPRNGLAVARLMAARMGALLPEAAGRFAGRAEALAAELVPRIDAWQEVAAPLRRHPLVHHTKQWEYLADWLGLELLGAVEHRPGISPSPRHVDDLIDRARRAGVRTLIAAPWNHLDVARRAAERMHAELVILPAAVGSIPEATDYPAMFDVILARLRATVPQE
ncbi:MAG: metal ABC transporter substrate-binding protein [Candidatus Krumholzibacteria bacterium]|nr:metal ABC transporter substrate-binding protein [Candidatus Krumholzibacteria bacterium]